MKRIALFGATGHIGKGIIYKYPSSEWRLSLFSRNVTNATRFLGGLSQDRGLVDIKEYGDFLAGEYDVVINAAGPGDPAKIRESGSGIFEITEYFDNLALRYLANHPTSAYINISTGVLYGDAYGSMACEDSLFSVSLNKPADKYHGYRVAKLNAEAKHRFLPQCAIADVRVFGYFSRFIDPNGMFFLSQVVRCLQKKKVFETSEEDFVRDYIGMDEIVDFVRKLIAAGTPNNSYDIYSARPTTKWELIEVLRDRFGLLCQTPSGRKKVCPPLISRYDRAVEIGYRPGRTSLDVIVSEMAALLQQSKGAMPLPESC